MSRPTWRPFLVVQNPPAVSNSVKGVRQDVHLNPCSVQHLPTLDQGTKRNVFQFSFVPYLELEASHGHHLIRPSTIVPENLY